MQITPLYDRVLLKRVDAAEEVRGGIIIPDTAKEKPQSGVVVAIGEGSKKVPITVAVGEKVLFPKYTGTEIKLGSDEYIIMDFDKVLAVLK